jgi:protein-S-isoprenylcysteine O-methyltransferase Ste14
MLLVADPNVPARRTLPMPDDEHDKAGVVAPPPLIYLVTLVLGLLLGRRFPIRFLPGKMARGLGMPLLGGGVLLLGWFEWTMRQADTPASPYRPVEHIATEGPFRYSRNPGYLSMAMIYAGIAGLANTLWAILLLPVALLAIQRGVIEREERYLEHKFGEEYLSYKTQVRRWI